MSCGRIRTPAVLSRVDLLGNMRNCGERQIASWEKWTDVLKNLKMGEQGHD